MAFLRHRSSSTLLVFAASRSARIVAEALDQPQVAGRLRRSRWASRPLCNFVEVREDPSAEVAPSIILGDVRLRRTEGNGAVLRLERCFATSYTTRIASEALAMKGDEERVLAASCEGYIDTPMRYRGFLETTDFRPAHARA